jgi:Cupin-like domain
LKFFLEHSTGLSSSSLYIAQYSLTDLPSPLQSDLPTPDLVTKSGKGDIYDSSLWMGRPPTFTPLHKDPNPNLFLQLAGQKMVRVFPPEVGRAMFDIVQAKLGYAGIASFRGDEMMQGPERDFLEEVVWADVPRWDADREEMEAMRNAGFEALLDLGEALFIPKGWWHSVRGVGSGMNVSVNWWFR